ncbi:amino acid aminotransferase [Mangrovicoccus algicola]|uniref:Aspartate/tyrosine/aromatic aminotransferase n=1 Tax=Mangrovicoccus algicola TaxID=2771008 RepID=A0A8J6YX71_9RHOB|nr:amino acid aminotransferase [Mangrovicoccus algicola]MBE3639475.1 aspartate/tyrosine/aromatic aminotransferase [Mangrovicoccus algicola]
MFSALPDQPEDKILKLMQMFREDPREQKIDLGVGVYKDPDGKTPIMRAVKAAEKTLWETETTKSYVALAGAPEFNDAMVALVLGDAVPRAEAACVATPGGTGAVRQGFDLVKLGRADATVWYSSPTWGNHVSILKHMNVAHKPYRYFDAATGEVDFVGMIADLATALPGDVVLLHGCCHNPTGANLTHAQWRQVVELLNERDLIPMIDIAYQGFGDGLEEDAFGVRLVAAECPETLIAASCSKNFGVYRERTGALMAVSRGGADTVRAQKSLAYLNRQNFSFPPDHGARLVSMILTDEALKADWMAELEEVRTGMLALREQLAAELKRLTNSDRFDFIARHRGMFSMLGLSSEEMDVLRESHGIYGVSDSRINIAGLNSRTVPLLAKAVAEVVGG